MVRSHLLAWKSDRDRFGVLDTVELVTHMLACVIVVQDDVLDEGVLIEVHLVLAEDAHLLQRWLQLVVGLHYLFLFQAVVLRVGRENRTSYAFGQTVAPT